MIHTHTMSQLKTVQEPLKLLRTGANYTNIAAASLATEVPTTVFPVPSGNPAGWSFAMIGASTLNYLKLIPFINTATPGSQAIRVTGYSLSDAGFYVPQLLFYGSISAVSATTVTINSELVYMATTLNKLEGDAKIYNASTSKSTAFILVDTLGCQHIRVEFINSASSGKGNAFYGAM